METQRDTISKKRPKRIIVKAFIVLVLTGAATVALFAHINGISGRTNLGCTCHGTSSTTTTLTPSAQSGSWTVQTNSTSTFTINIANSSRNYFGIDIAVKTASDGDVNAGTLTAGGSDLYSLNSELTHSAPKNGTAGTSFSFTWTAPSTAGTYYLKAAGNAVNNDGTNSGDLWNFMGAQAITVVAPTQIVISSPNGGENWCAGSSRNISWTSSNVTNVNIDISSNGGSSFSSLATNISASSGNWSWNIPSGQLVGTQYRIRISDASNSNTKDASRSNFSIAPATAITSQPQSVTSCSGLQVQMSVMATGTNLTYQWRKDGADVQGGTTATLILANVQTANAGTYICVVSGACGSPITSNSAVLTVDAAPMITDNPTPSTICAGQQTSFSVKATGVQLTYQWRRNGTPLANGTSAALILSNIKESDAGNYDCVVSGKCSPQATSTAAALTVNAAPSISIQPKPLTACEGSNDFIFVKASGTTLTYSWLKNGTAIPNTNKDTLFFRNINSSDAGYYSVKISGTCVPDLTSGAAQVTVNPLATITSQPANQTVTEGSSAKFNIKASGQNLIYQWYKDMDKLAGKTADSLELAGVKLTDAGSYHCEIDNTCGKKSSDTVKLTVIPVGNGPVLTLSIDRYDFGYTQTGMKKEQTIKSLITNNGNENLVITGINITQQDSGVFGINMPQLPLTIAAGKTIDLTLWFQPLNLGAKSGTLKFTSNSVINTELKLSGTGATLDVRVAAKELTISSPAVGTKGSGTVQLENKSSVPVKISVNISGADSSSFSLVESYSNYPVDKDSTEGIVVEFNPLSIGTKHAELNIAVNETGQSFSIPLNGTITTGVNYEAGNSILYPNPARDEINIDLSKIGKEILNLKIYDSNGRLLLTETGGVISNNFVWNLSDENYRVSNGIYRLLIETKDKVYSYPIIIIH